MVEPNSQYLFGQLMRRKNTCDFIFSEMINIQDSDLSIIFEYENQNLYKLIISRTGVHEIRILFTNTTTIDHSENKTSIVTYISRTLVPCHNESKIRHITFQDHVDTVRSSCSKYKHMRSLTVNITGKIHNYDYIVGSVTTRTQTCLQ